MLSSAGQSENLILLLNFKIKHSQFKQKCRVGTRNKMRIFVYFEIQNLIKQGSRIYESMSKNKIKSKVNYHNR